MTAGHILNYGASCRECKTVASEPTDLETTRSKQPSPKQPSQNNRAKNNRAQTTEPKTIDCTPAILLINYYCGETPLLYALGPVWKSGDLEFPSIDNPAGLFDCEDLHKSSSLIDSWEKPTLITSEKSEPIDSYFCVSEHFAFSPDAVAVLKEVAGEKVEWLPVEIHGIGEYFFINPLVSLSLGPDSKFERNDVSKNIVEITNYNFLESDLDGLNVFRISQPEDSSAGEAGFSLSSIVVSEAFHSTWKNSNYKGIEFKSLPTS